MKVSASSGQLAAGRKKYPFKKESLPHAASCLLSAASWLLALCSTLYAKSLMAQTKIPHVGGRYYNKIAGK